MMVTNAVVPTLRPGDVLEHALLSAWAEVSGMGLCVVDDAFEVVMVNPAACSLLGVDAAAVLNGPLTAALANLDASTHLLPWIDSTDPQGQQHVTKTTLQGQQQLLLKLRGLRIATGAQFTMLSITDLTAVLATQKLEEQRRQWQALNAGVVVSDALAPDMPVVYVNPMFEAMSGFTSAEMVGRNCRHLQGSETDQPGLVAIRNAIRTQTNGYAVLRNYRKDGSLFTNELFISPIKNAQGQVTHYMGIQHPRDNAFLAAAA